ncbi:hypothetical protein RHGRI_032470 [Rhododendron griersonianum]|uniref:Uncharacterized protein n=1 Tax=Rhododendron griersonianum TaxID=479676 RepID=A0AAV6IHU0_9ERIC|nr:hypothetical protein RHGRI_032470 [Rhododendron griersonianum]
MDQKPELPTQLTTNSEEERGGLDEEEFYEKIEAPKFVDFTAPDPYRPDDRYWFCLRVGCDQKHEEEIDHEAISKDFVLRVMAARSPYIRLRQILNRKASSAKEKCPLSAPPKPSKSRVSRLAVISSFSQKLIDGKGKAKPLSKIASTPKAKGKQVAAKYLTTPRNKNCVPNPNFFRSVQNPKPASIAVPKSRTVAKTLVFHSPKKGIVVKTSSELRTPLTKICEGLKRLEITGQRKRILGYSNKSSKEIRCGPNKSVPVDPSMRNLSSCKNKSKAKDLFRTQKNEKKETKSLRCIKRKSEGNSNKSCDSRPKKLAENNKPREGTVLENSGITQGKAPEGPSQNEKISGNSDSMDSSQEEAIPCSEVAQSIKPSDIVSSEASRGEMNPSSNSKEGNLEENDLSKFQANLEEQGNESQTLGEEVGHEGEAMESDDKENASASNGNRDFKDNNNQSGRKLLGKQETNEVTKKVARTQYKNLKEGVTGAATGAQGMKYKKPKPTNPKPFRLRTDERRILKEANLERRMQSIVPENETAKVSTLPAGILQKRHGSEMQRNGKCLEESNCNHETHESSGKELETSLQKNEPHRTVGPRTPEEQVRLKTATTTPQRSTNSTQRKSKPVTLRFEQGREVITQYVRPKGVSSTRKAMTSELVCGGEQLTVIKETSSAPSRSEEAAEPSRDTSRGKRPKTIPKEPNFHSVHVPKSCTRKVA